MDQIEYLRKKFFSFEGWVNLKFTRFFKFFFIYIQGGISRFLSYDPKTTFMVMKKKYIEHKQIRKSYYTTDHDRLHNHVRNTEVFVPKYYRDCPKTKLDDIRVYIGVLKLGDYQVPIINVTTKKAELKNKILIMELSRFGVLKQFSPLEDPIDAGHQYDIFVFRVIDLNENTKRRQEIINEI